MSQQPAELTHVHVQSGTCKQQQQQLCWLQLQSGGCPGGTSVCIAAGVMDAGWEAAREAGWRLPARVA